jgi:DNA-binding transcriptional regulator YhcF (GntR family)
MTDALAAPLAGQLLGLQAPSLVVLAADEIPKTLFRGQYAPGERLIEERSTEELAISRPPLREALWLLENGGMIRTRPRRGTFVSTMTDQDVYEILTLRSALERTAFELGIVVTHPALLDPARTALAEMERCAAAADRRALVQAATSSTPPSLSSPPTATGSEALTARARRSRRPTADQSADPARPRHERMSGATSRACSSGC